MRPNRPALPLAALLYALPVLVALMIASRVDHIPVDVQRAEEKEKEEEDEAGETGEKVPNEWFYLQRAYPRDVIDPADLERARTQATALRDQAPDNAGVWDPVGPTNIGGRIADLAIHPLDPFTVYVGAAEGGVIKTTDGGITWIPTFDDLESLSIGDLAVHPTNGDIVYAGTGEPNGGGGSVTYGGAGVYKTTNGGATWNNVGLTESRYIGRVAIDPVDPDRVFVAALGALFSTSSERGVYRSTNAGGSWEQVLSVSDSTGAVDLVIDPANPDRIYAATWERIRHPHTRRYGGPTSAVYRSTDGGDTWTILGGGLPSPQSVNGRIGLSLCASHPQVIYAIYADQVGFFAGVYRSTNGGDTWTRTNDGALSGAYSSFGWWFGNIRVQPNNPDRVYVLGLNAYRTTNGGASWSQIGSNMHVDHHAMEFAPVDVSVIYEGNDGGLYLSDNDGNDWNEITGLPITQFYTVEVDFQLPERRYGGTQDNGTNRTLTGAATDWQSIYGGDGFYVLVDPTDNRYVYAESQYGGLGRSTNGGSSFSGATSGLSGRENWSMPVTLDPSDPTVLYCGTSAVFRSTNRAASWSSISGDLTDGSGGSGGVVFGTITTLAVAPTDPQVVYAGTDDANVWVTTNGGGSWNRIDAALPERWVTRVAVDPTSAAIAYVTLSGFRDDDPLPHVFRTTDFGDTWSPVSGNLPEAPVNDLVIDPDTPSTLIVATDVGVYVSYNGGAAWSALGTGLPNGVVTDLTLHGPSRLLTAATYGRSMFTYDLGATTGVDVAVAVASPPLAPRLSPASPNPTPGATDLAYDLPRPARVSLDIYDVSGRLVRKLVDRDEQAGSHTARWNGANEQGAGVGPGVYIARLATDGVSRTRKINVSR